MCRLKSSKERFLQVRELLTVVGGQGSNDHVGSGGELRNGLPDLVDLCGSIRSREHGPDYSQINYSLPVHNKPQKSGRLAKKLSTSHSPNEVIRGTRDTQAFAAQEIASAPRAKRRARRLTSHAHDPAGA